MHRTLQASLVPITFAAQLCVEPLVLQVLVETGDIFAVAVEQQGRHALVAAQHALRCLAPARMGHLRIHIGPEAVFGSLDRLPKLTGCLSVKVKRTRPLADLKPYFHGVAKRSGAPFCLGAGLP